MAEKVFMRFPETITVELPKDQKVAPFAAPVPPALVKKVLELSFRGVVHRDGSWRVNPNNWTIEKDQNKYKVIHNLGYDNCSLSVSLLVQPGSFTIKEHSPTYFIVETLLDRAPTDLDFSFVLARVISQPAQPVDRSV